MSGAGLMPLSDPAVTSTLSPRELAALIAYAKTGDQRQAAHLLGLTHHTLKGTLLWNAYQKLGVTNAIDAFRAMGWLQVPS